MEAERLEAIRLELQSELVTVQHQLTEYVESVGDGGAQGADLQGFADSAHATAERSELLSLIEQLESTQSEITDALAKIEDGTYGKCERCGEAIALERLEAIPTVSMCVACKQAMT